MLREIKILKGLAEMCKTENRQSYTPDLHDLMKGHDEKGDIVIFFVMEYIESDLADLIALGPESGLT